MKKKKIKKAIILLVVLAVIGGGAAGGLFAYKNYRSENMQAEVRAVSSLNWGYWGDNMTSVGYVANDYVQSVYTDDKTVAELKVSEGDSVSIGDVLLVYDTTDVQLQIEMEQLELQGIENDIKLAERDLEKLKKITPVSSTTSNQPASSKPSTSTNKTTVQKKKPSSVVVMQVQKKDGDAYNYIDKTAKPYEGKGTPDKPYRFLCTPECYVTGEYLNLLVKKEQVAAFEIWSGNSLSEGTLISCWTVNGGEKSAVDKDSKWAVATQEQLEEDVVLEEETEETTEKKDTQTTEKESDEPTYTADELRKEIAEKENEIKKLNVDKKKSDIELQKLKKEQESASVLATINGVIKTAGDPENPPMDGSAFVEVTGAEGMYIEGTISELMLDQIEVGQEISANSWTNGQVYMATITEISEYPSEGNGGYYGEGNPNVSYYTFLAYIDNPEGLNNGDYLELSITPTANQEETNSLFIDKAYVREENGRYYVLKAGAEDRLEKHYIQTGRTVYGSAIEIKSGLAETDRIAFPYGKTAKEGIKAVDAEN